MHTENNSCSHGTVRAIAVLGCNRTKLFRHPNIIDIAKNVLQRLQLLDKGLDILARKDRSEELREIAQLRQGAAASCVSEKASKLSFSIGTRALTFAARLRPKITSDRELWIKPLTSILPDVLRILIRSST